MASATRRERANHCKQQNKIERNANRRQSVTPIEKVAYAGGFRPKVVKAAKKIAETLGIGKEKK